MDDWLVVQFAAGPSTAPAVTRRRRFPSSQVIKFPAQHIMDGSLLLRHFLLFVPAFLPGSSSGIWPPANEEGFTVRSGKRQLVVSALLRLPPPPIIPGIAARDLPAIGLLGGTARMANERPVAGGNYEQNQADADLRHCLALNRCLPFAVIASY